MLKQNAKKKFVKVNQDLKIALKIADAAIFKKLGWKISRNIKI